MDKKILKQIVSKKISFIFFQLPGLAAVIWFLVRVISKPSRACYPCRRVAAGVGSSSPFRIIN